MDNDKVAEAAEMLRTAATWVNGPRRGKLLAMATKLESEDSNQNAPLDRELPRFNDPDEPNYEDDQALS